MIHPLSESSIGVASVLALAGLVVESVQLKTPDGRTWEVMAVPAGRGRKPDHSWGPMPGKPAGFRLFEVDPEGRRGVEEHDNPDSDRWMSSDLSAYLLAVGAVKASKPARPACSCDPFAPKSSSGRGDDGWLTCSTCRGRIGDGAAELAKARKAVKS